MATIKMSRAANSVIDSYKTLIVATQFSQSGTRELLRVRISPIAEIEWGYDLSSIDNAAA